MRCSPLVLTSLLASATTVLAGRSLGHVGKRLEQHVSKRAAGAQDTKRFAALPRAVDEPLFLNANTTKFAVNGTGIPDVDFDVGESYAGSLPISSDPDEDSNLFFWFFPSKNPAAEKEILIWLNGGPGCSSFEGLLQENGPFVWQYGTYKPVANPWAWNALTHTVWVEQPVGTGFSTGTITAKNEDDIASQFMGFWKNFVDTFAMQGYKVYIAGESYAGVYCPYIASAMLDAEDKTYYNMSGMLIYDPVIATDELQEPIPAVQFVDYFAGLFPFNDTFKADLKARDKKCGYSDFVEKYLVYPPKGNIPLPLPGTDANGTTLDECWNIYYDIFDAALLVNPCFDIYQIATTCPLLWDVLGFPGSLEYLPNGTTLYFDRPDVKAAIHAPANVTWEECSSDDVFVGGRDGSPPSNLKVLPNVIDKTQNVIIGHGALDMILLANGTLLGIQNMTFGGKLGFQERPDEPFYVPYNDITTLESLAAGGVFGTTHTERGLTYVGIDLSGHMIPQYAPSAAFRHLEFLLGRVDCMNCTTPFTIDTGAPQSAQSLGLGTAPQGWSDKKGNSTCTKRKRTSVKDKMRLLRK